MKKKLSQKEAYKIATDPQFVKSLMLGPWTSYSFLHDPIHLSFVLSRYKFCAKMLKGKKNVLEVGCGDAFGVPIVAQFVGKVLGIDVDRRLIDDDTQRLAAIKNLKFQKLNICEEVPKDKFDGVFAIDVIEHLDKPLEKLFLQNICQSLTPDGTFILGTPNATAYKFASHRGKIEHINNKTLKSLEDLLQNYFRHVFMFSMNDEVVHTGFGPMSHYLWGIGIDKKS